MDYDAHVRARVGHRFGQADVFIAGGLAITELQQDDSEFDVHETKTLTGFTIGAGVDWPITENMIARVEVLHDDYGKVDTAGNFSGYTGDWADTTVRGGLLFHF
jgi:outer membrane immunogenic protein